VRAAVGLPIVAIGGIHRASAASALAAGADAVAMISELASADDVAARVRQVLGLLTHRSGAEIADFAVDNSPTAKGREIMAKLYGVALSPFVRKVRVALAEKGVAYEHDPVIPVNVSAEYRKKSPLGKIPAFEDGDKTLADSSVICAYLDRVHPSPRCIRPIPTNTRARCGSRSTRTAGSCR